MDSIPVIDFSEIRTNPEAVAQHVFEACKSIGFFYVIHHDIPAEDINKTFALAKEFFDLPREEKQRYAIDKENHGYSAVYSEKLDPEHQRQGDHKEGFNFRMFDNDKAFAPLPKVFEEEEPFINAFTRKCHSVAIQILETFAIALKIPEAQGGRDFFKQYHTYEHSGEILRLLKYPKCANKNEQPPPIAEEEEPVRAGAHSDYGSITLLFQKDVPGLEVQASREKWISAPLIDNAIIVNVGDQMELWTHGLFKSTKHRVTFLPQHKYIDRYSIPFFMHPVDHAPLSPVPSPFVDTTLDKAAANEKTGEVLTAGQHLRNRLDATYTYSDNKENSPTTA
ncbi:hypothetical protein BDF20DRAFT_614679 [Mycotypha africana]|uniref:uncharacterized protein n=1 Tax=Mycotypha africana TaxID=64632 RepID=UPI002300F3E2|nr:uncharacterized protein BDF20DRAFT_614679 [Mycotypha africana]KAI8975551.1 hypothetical protein BDF20DRAFT_614679 [Mycotypha africana]